jgi:hypothetical protein
MYEPAEANVAETAVGSSVVVFHAPNPLAVRGAK